jgi:hypothetical protein
MIPPKKELIVRVEMTAVQRRIYKSVLAKDLDKLRKLQIGKEVGAASNGKGGPMVRGLSLAYNRPPSSASYQLF